MSQAPPVGHVERGLEDSSVSQAPPVGHVERGLGGSSVSQAPLVGHVERGLGGSSVSQTPTVGRVERGLQASFMVQASTRSSVFSDLADCINGSSVCSSQLLWWRDGFLLSPEWCTRYECVHFLFRR